MLSQLIALVHDLLLDDPDLLLLVECELLSHHSLIYCTDSSQCEYGLADNEFLLLDLVLDVLTAGVKLAQETLQGFLLGNMDGHRQSLDQGILRTLG